MYNQLNNFEFGDLTSGLQIERNILVKQFVDYCTSRTKISITSINGCNLQIIHSTCMKLISNCLGHFIISKIQYYTTSPVCTFQFQISYRNRNYGNAMQGSQISTKRTILSKCTSSPAGPFSLISTVYGLPSNCGTLSFSSRT